MTKKLRKHVFRDGPVRVGRDDTEHLLSSLANRKHLMTAIRDAEAGRLTEHELIEREMPMERD